MLPLSRHPTPPIPIRAFVRLSARPPATLAVQYKVAGGLVLGTVVPWMCSYAVANDPGSRRLVGKVSPSYGEQDETSGQRERAREGREGGVTHGDVWFACLVGTASVFVFWWLQQIVLENTRFPA